MVWKYKTKELQAGRSWVDDNKIRHPSNWTNWSADYKKSMNITWTDDPDPFDDKFYWGYQADGKTLIERKIADENAKDESGNLIKDQDGNQVVYKGLKSTWIERTKTSANGRLQATDWYVTRKAEAGTAIPSDVSTYRTAVRTSSKTIEDKINACSDLTAFKKLFDTPVDSDGKSTGTAPIYDFPKEVTND